MIKLLKILFLTVLTPYINLLQAQKLSNKGREFWVGYGHHQFMETDNSQEMVLYFSVEQAAHVVVTINGTSYREEYNIAANSVIQSKPIPKGFESVPASFFDARLYTKPPSFPGGTGSEGIFKTHAIHIESDVPIVAYAHIYGDASSGATMLMPVETWGHSYISVNTPQHYSSSFGGNFNCFSWMYVVAQRNNTRVRIVPTVNTRKGNKAGVPIIVNLQKGEIYQLLGAPIDAERGENVAGTTVTSIENNLGECYPITLFSGSSRTRITCQDVTTGSGDNIMQQGFPIQAWGKRYLTVPTSVDNAPDKRNINVFRIIVKDPATVVKKNGLVLMALNTSNGYYYEYQSNTPDFIEADKPVMVAQYMPTASACSYTGLGDPEMILISPIEQSIKQIGFYRNIKENIQHNFLSLIIPSGGLSSLSIDGAVGGYNVAYAHPNYPGYSVVVKKWKASQAQCLVKSDSAFTAITYGMGPVESYGYNAGTYINNLNGYPAIKNKFGAGTTDNEFTCVNTPVQLSVLMRYQPTVLNWKLSQLQGVMSPAADVVQTNPVASDTQTINGIPYYRYTLPDYYQFSHAGNHSIPLLATSPAVETCNQTEEIQYIVEVRKSAAIRFNILYVDCRNNQMVEFKGADTLDNGSPVFNWQWNFSDNTTGSGKTISHEFAAGNHFAQLMAVDSVGCVADTTQLFSFIGKPNMPSFTIQYSDSCAGARVVFADNTTQPGMQKWFWDFGKNDTLTVFSNAPVSRTFSQPDTILVKHVAMATETCASDTAFGKVVIYPNPVASFSMPGNVCLPKGEVQFTNLSTIIGSDSLRYEWQFGDGSPISTQKDPIHSYKALGGYTVSLKTQSSKGCFRTVSQLYDKLIEKPKAMFSANPDNVCQGVAIVFRDASLSSNSQVTNWNWSFGDGSASNEKNPTKLYSSPGNYQVKLVVKNEGGCTSDTVSQPVTVHIQPVVDAGRSFVAKEGDVIEFEATANATSLSFSWSPATGLDNPNVLRPNLTVSTDQLYTLTATGSNNCQSSDQLSVTVPKGIFVPNAFSPNGDGYNDVWKIKNLEHYAKSTVQIFDRYGSLVYRTNGQGKPWDGTLKGSNAPPGTYYYLIHLNDGSPPKSGSVTLLR